MRSTNSAYQFSFCPSTMHQHSEEEESREQRRPRVYIAKLPVLRRTAVVRSFSAILGAMAGPEHRAPADGNANLTEEERGGPFAVSVLASFSLLNLPFSSIPYGETYRSKLSTQRVYIHTHTAGYLRNINSEIIVIFQGFVSRGRDYYSPFGEIDIWTPIYIYFYSLVLFSSRGEQSYEIWWKLFKRPGAWSPAWRFVIS